MWDAWPDVARIFLGALGGIALFLVIVWLTTAALRDRH
jgi:hypothetical protein